MLFVIKLLFLDKLEIQPGDEDPMKFSFMDTPRLEKQRPCWIGYTNKKVHEILETGFEKSPMFQGRIQGLGPRYCPSIEDKIHRFADKDAHQIFVEPEGLTTSELYPNGISTSLPFDIQVALVQSIVGFENAHITRPGYAIEYDYFDPRDIHPWLETKAISGLFFAGQINGTTGYEEAAAQGLLAGINAALRHQQKQPWYPGRDEAYIGVLVDDLVTRGTSEPYRMFTSRAEYRLLLREDNADMRLTELGHRLGVVDDARAAQFYAKREQIAAERTRLNSTWMSPDRLDAETATAVLGQPLRKEQSLADLLRRPEMDYASLMRLPGAGPAVGDPAVVEQLEIDARYSGYLERQQDEIEKLKLNEKTSLPADIDYASVRGLSNEITQKLSDHRPTTIGQASRISGVTPAAISLLLVHLKKNRNDYRQSA